MRWLKASSCILLVLLAPPVKAEGFVFVPKWKLTLLPDGSTQACYDFEKAKLLAQLDIDLGVLAELKLEVPVLRKDAEDLASALGGQIQHLESKSLELETQNAALLKALRVSERERIIAQNNPAGAFGWVTAAGIMLIAVGEAIAFGIASAQTSPKP